MQYDKVNGKFIIFDTEYFPYIFFQFPFVKHFLAIELKKVEIEEYLYYIAGYQMKYC